MSVSWRSWRQRLVLSYALQAFGALFWLQGAKGFSAQQHQHTSP
jgi:hypothetical protein